MLYFICSFIILVYLIVITLLNYGFNKVKEFKLQDLEPKTKFSIVVPSRNEASNYQRRYKYYGSLYSLVDTKLLWYTELYLGYVLMGYRV